jgi:hypothetical protein
METTIAVSSLWLGGSHGQCLQNQRIRHPAT